MSQHQLARQIVDAWTELANCAPAERAASIRQTEVSVGGLDDLPVGDEHLARRLVVPRVEDALISVMKRLAIDRDDAVQRIESLLAREPGGRALLDGIARTVLPGSPEGAKVLSEILVEMGVDCLTRHGIETFTRVVTTSIWEYTVEPLVGKSHPAVPIEIVRPLATLLSGACTFPSAGSGWWAIRRGTHDIGYIRGDLTVGRPRATQFANNFSPEVFELVGSKTGHRLLRELVARSWEAMLLGASEPERIVIEGGWLGLGSDLGIGGSDKLHRLRQIGRVLDLVELRPDDGAPVRLFELRAATSRVDGSSRAPIEFRLRNELRPRYVTAKRKGLDRSLVPLPMTLPPVTSTKLMARAFSYQMLLLFEMRRRATEFDGERALHIPLDKRRAYARDVKLNDESRLAIEEAWCAAGPEQFLEYRSGEHFRLGRAYESVDVFLADAARRSHAGRRRRQRGGARRAP